MDDQQAHELQRDREQASLLALENCWLDGAAEDDVMELAGAIGVSSLLKPRLDAIKVKLEAMLPIH